MIRILCCFLFWLCGSIYPAGAAQLQPTKEYKLLVFGDSLSAGYALSADQSFAAQLQTALEKAGYTQVKVINKSRSGETTAGGLKRIAEALKEKPNGVILELGINDVFQGRGISSITQNLSELIEKFQNDNVVVLLAGMKAPPITEPVYARQFEQMYFQLAKKYHITLYPFFMQGLFETAGNDYQKALPYLQGDHVHPTREGVSFMVQHILPTIISFLKKQKVYPSH